MEAQILDYQTQQYKLLPLLASAFAMYFTGRYAEDYYEEIASEIEEGKLDSLNQVRNWEDVFAVFFSVVRAYHSNPFGFKRSYMSSLQRVNFFTSRYVDIVSVDSSGNIAIQQQQQQHHQQQHLHSINTDKNNNNNNFISRHKRQHTTQYIIKEVR